jgi:hypothetical protein
VVGTVVFRAFNLLIIELSFAEKSRRKPGFQRLFKTILNNHLSIYTGEIRNWLARLALDLFVTVLTAVVVK